jgi:hypothetical protein
VGSWQHPTISQEKKWPRAAHHLATSYAQVVESLLKVSIIEWIFGNGITGEKQNQLMKSAAMEIDGIPEALLHNTFLSCGAVNVVHADY